ncbi:ParB N-terminal domain-containing protein [Dysgonomonas sp. GY75]|uniref:ParB N-terminal domain-containing protein n=1 Tax=Dysgonomonas sp. GY75 TaxID=2780419 RepID=UPI001884376C|nr:ParB N-terminal domain-containing protein [Dysgonomonas sp. GY75]MBF0651259.1 ParB N-terminal domain-containing protein [Dysgonomonas sp. GY75]
MNIKQSETRIIKRSQINLNPYNPKKHSDKAISDQKKNIQKVGYLGGITWNEITGNLIDGHRRLMALDSHYKYDGSNDYELKVEVVHFDPKTEKEQMTYMAIGNTKADLQMIANYYPEINLSDIGVSDNILLGIEDFIIPDIAPIETIDIIEKKQPETKEQIKAKKEKFKENDIQKYEDMSAYLTLSFSSFENFVAFCDMFGYDPYKDKIIKGEEFVSKLEE